MSVSTLRPAHLAAAVGAVAVIAFLAARTPWTASASATRASNVAVDCEPTQRALVRQIVTDGDPQVTVRCVSGAGAQPVAYVDASGRILEPSAAAASGVVPAVYTTTSDRVVATAPRVTRSAPVRRAATTTARAGTPKRDWKKTTLIIGGSAGAGAGVGAIVGGKKGAAIGAAIGGGAAALYEAMKK